jgi:hypothetical protein
VKLTSSCYLSNFWSDEKNGHFETSIFIERIFYHLSASAKCDPLEGPMIIGHQGRAKITAKASLSAEKALQKTTKLRAKACVHIYDELEGSFGPLIGDVFAIFGLSESHNKPTFRHRAV